MVGLIIDLAILAAVCGGIWKALEKMGHKGNDGLIPIYNLYILSQVMGKDIVWFIMCLIPFVNIVPMIDVAKRWGKGTGFAVGLALLSFVFWPMLGFTSAQPQAAAA